MGRKPYIAITLNYDPSDKLGLLSTVGAVGQDWMFLAADYVRAIEKAGGVPLLLPQCSQFSSLEPLLELADGFLITGGHDVDPSAYGADRMPYCGDTIALRDQQDLALVRYVLAHKKPYLGICRGMQLLNVAQGGTLYQDLQKEGSYENHSFPELPRTQTVHSVSLAGGLQAIYQTGRLDVNSFHHQAVQRLGTGILPLAKSEDGVVEAIGYEGCSFAIAVQWHPEMLYDRPEQDRLFSAFLSAC